MRENNDNIKKKRVQSSAKCTSIGALPTSDSIILLLLLLILLMCEFNRGEYHRRRPIEKANRVDQLYYFLP